VYIKTCIFLLPALALHFMCRAQGPAGTADKVFSTDSIVKNVQGNFLSGMPTGEKEIAVVKEKAEKYKNEIGKKVSLADSVSQKAAELLKTPDSVLSALQALPNKYFKKVNDKVEKYSSRVTGKTEKTLLKLCKWEDKVRKTIEKASPEAAQRLFSNPDMTFAGLLKKVKEKEAMLTAYKGQYNEYLDKLNTNVEYIKQQKEKLNTGFLQPVNATSKKLKEVTGETARIDAIEQMIKERKKQLMNEALKYAGSSKYLKRIDKETWYYAETIKNYKQILADPEKTEKAVRDVLDKIPAYREFASNNSWRSALFGKPASLEEDMASLAGLQTRAGVQEGLSESYTSAPDAKQLINQSVQDAKSRLNSLKDKANKHGNDSDVEEPGFKPNNQKTKTFLQRLEYGTNIQFAKNNSLLPSTADLAMNVGYKINDKSIVGIGASYKLGLGSMQQIRLSHQGIGLRSYMDWKLKKEFYMSGGFEMNYQAQLNNIAPVQNYNDWQSSGLVGITKKFKVKTKFFKATKLQLFYDLLSRQHVPVSQPVLFRVGYNFSK